MNDSPPTAPLRITVIGASRGSGRAVVESLAGDGHRVTAFARSVADTELPTGVRVVAGDVADPAALDRAVAGADAVVITLGISDSALAVRLRRRASTALDVRSAGTRAVIAAMRRHGVRRLVVQTTYGAGDSYPRLSLSWKLTFRLVIAEQLTDSDRQEDVVRASGLDWTLIRPVALTDGVASEPALVSAENDVASMKVTRGQVAAAITAAVTDPARVGRTLAVSGRSTRDLQRGSVSARR